MRHGRSGFFIMLCGTVLCLLLPLCLAQGTGGFGFGDTVIDNGWIPQTSENSGSSYLEPSFTHLHSSSPEFQPPILSSSITPNLQLVSTTTTTVMLSSQLDDVTFDQSLASVFRLRGGHVKEAEDFLLSYVTFVSLTGNASFVDSLSQPSAATTDVTSYIHALPTRAIFTTSYLMSPKLMSSESTSSKSFDFLLSSKTVHDPSDSEKIRSVSIEPSPVLMMSVNSSLLHDVTRFQPSEATVILRLKIQVDRTVQVRSFQFMEMMKMALERLYQAALDKQRVSKTGERRQKRQVQPQVSAQVVGVGRDTSSGGGDSASVDFTLADNGRQVTADAAMSALSNLTSGQIEGIIIHPVLGLTKEKVAINSSLTVGDTTDADLTVITTGNLIIATRKSTSSSSSSPPPPPPSSSSSLTSPSSTDVINKTSVMTSTSSLTPSLTSLSTVVNMSSTKVSSLDVSPSPTSTVTPSSSQIPVDTLRNALLSVDLDLKHTRNEKESDFKRNFEGGIVRAYLQARQSRRKRDVPIPDVIIHVQRHERYLRQAGSEIDAQVTQVQKNTNDPGLTNVTFYVLDNGQPVPSSVATVTLNKLTDTALSAALGYPVMSRALPVDRPYVPPATSQRPVEDYNDRLFVVIIVLPSVLLLLLIVTLTATLVHSCCYPLSSTPEIERAVATKYQRGDSVSDYSQNLEMERGPTMELTPVHSRNSTPVFFPHSHNGYSIDSTRRREHPHQWPLSDQRQRQRRVDSAESVYHEYYKNGYLETSFSGRLDPASRHQSREDVSLARTENNDDLPEEELEKRPSSIYTQKKPPPQARPRSFMRKLQHSLKNDYHHHHQQYSPDRDMSALGDSIYISATAKNKPRDSSKGREGKSRDGKSHAQQPTDASSEFTVMVPMFTASRSSRERLTSANSAHTDLSGEGHKNTTPQQPASEPSLPKSSLQSNSQENLTQREEPDIPPELSSSKKPASPPREGKKGKAGGLSRVGGSYPSLCTTQTQTSLSSHSDVSEGRKVGRKSVGVGPDNFNKKTQTTLPRESRAELKVKRKPRKQPSFGYKHPPEESEQQKEQKQEFMEYVHRQMAASHPSAHTPSPIPIITTTTAPPTTFPTITNTTKSPESNRETLEKLLNEACVLVPPRSVHPGSASRDPTPASRLAMRKDHSYYYYGGD